MLLESKINGSIFHVRHTISLIFTIISSQVHKHVLMHIYYILTDKILRKQVVYGNTR